MRLSSSGRLKLKAFEALRLKAYYCSAGVPTIGWGTTKGVTHEDVKNGRTISEVEAQRLFDIDVGEFEQAVSVAVLAPATQNQFDAMVLLAYNIGIPRFKTSTVLKAHNRGDVISAARAFMLWDKITVSGKLVVSPGLVSRRTSEAALYAKADPLAPLDMPQEVAPERPLTESKINQGAIVAGGVSMLAGATQVLDAVKGFKVSLLGLENWWLPCAALAVAGICGYIVWERIQQRKEGRA